MTDELSNDELVRRGLRRSAAFLVDQLFEAVGDGEEPEVLRHTIDMWVVNNFDDVTIDQLIDAGKPTPCSDCDMDVCPYNEDGSLVEHGWEMYMVTDDIWRAATAADQAVQYLCVGCMERRLGRKLKPDDFNEASINDPSWMSTERLLNRQGSSLEELDG